MNADGSNEKSLGPGDEPDWQPLAIQGVAGDVDCNGRVNGLDALMTLRSGARVPSNARCEPQGDVNADGDIDSLDAALILQYDAGFPSSLGR